MSDGDVARLKGGEQETKKAGRRHLRRAPLQYVKPAAVRLALPACRPNGGGVADLVLHVLQLPQLPRSGRPDSGVCLSTGCTFELPFLPPPLPNQHKFFLMRLLGLGSVRELL
jgi:hypothetical protein